MRKQNFSFRRNEHFLWEKRLCYWFDSEAVKISKQETKKSKEVTKQAAIQAKLRKDLAKLGIPWEADSSQTTGDSQLETEAAVQHEEITGATSNLNILHRITPKKLEKYRILSRRINEGLAGKNVKSKKKRSGIQMANQSILQELDPTYTRPSSGDYSQETEQVIAKIVKNEIDVETLKKAEASDPVSEQLVAQKIEQVYGLLDAARNLHREEIRKNARNMIGVAMGTEVGEHRKDLKREGILGMRPNKFEKKKAKVFKRTEVEGAKKEKGFLRKERSAKPVINLLKKPFNFLLDKTFRKGATVGIARSALWIGGSAVTGGLPIIPVAVETAIWAGKKIKLGERTKKTGAEAEYVTKNVANIGTLGIPRFAFGLLKKFWNAVKLDRKPKKEKQNK